jgi:cytochrome P450
MSSFGGLRRSRRRPPRHTKLGSLVSKGFTPRQAARLTDLEFNMFFLLLINAGGDTIRNLVPAGILALMENPAEHARLAADDVLSVGRPRRDTVGRPRRLRHRSRPNPHLAFGGGGTISACGRI